MKLNTNLSANNIGTEESDDKFRIICRSFKSAIKSTNFDVELVALVKRCSERV